MGEEKIHRTLQSRYSQDYHQNQGIDKEPEKES